MAEELAEEWTSDLGDQMEEIYQTEKGTVIQLVDIKFRILNSHLTQNQMLILTPIHSYHARR